jgi:hypothetical protein
VKLTDELKYLLADKNSQKVLIRFVFGKTELAPDEKEWFDNKRYIHVSFLQELQAKCYLSENVCVITSLNLLEYIIKNNDEMGVLIENRNKDKDPEEAKLYEDAYIEAKRIIQI